MYSVSFIFEPKQFDGDFAKLNFEIGEYANNMSGFLGTESWTSGDGQRRNEVYFWEDLDALREFSQFSTHVYAKKHYKKWYKGYHIVVAKIVRMYGDGAIDHVTDD